MSQVAIPPVSKPEIDSADDTRVNGEQLDPNRLFSTANIGWNRFSPLVFAWIASVHIGALFAPFYFSWSGLFLCILFHWLGCSIGICLGYHRLLSHRSFKLAKPVEFFCLLCGVLTGQGAPLYWAATHRVHHAFSDEVNDPHTPHDGPWWSHLYWVFFWPSYNERQALYQKYAPDLMKRPMLQFFEATNYYWLIGFGVALYLIGGMEWFIWAYCLRIALTYQSTFFVNSATHLWGYRSYETKDDSKNLWWVALAAYGEGWHNNHHAHPSVAPAGHKWWEFDATWMAIKALRFCGLATDVKDKRPEPKTDATAA